jgi:hypothetical protein
MPSSGMLSRVAIVRIDISEECIDKLLRLIVPITDVSSLQVLVTLIMEVICLCEESVLTRATIRHISEDDILHSHCREDLKSYIALTG